MKDEESFKLVDLGDAMKETKQFSPWPPFYVDSVYGFGVLPNV